MDPYHISDRQDIDHTLLTHAAGSSPDSLWALTPCTGIVA